MESKESNVGVLQYAVSAAIPGFVVGAFSGTCCCIFQVPIGILSGLLLRIQKGAPLTFTEGAVAGIAGGLVSGLLHPVFSVSSSFLLDQIFGDKTNFFALGLGGAAGIFVGLAMGILFGALGGLLVACEPLVFPKKEEKQLEPVKQKLDFTAKKQKKQL